MSKKESLMLWINHHAKDLDETELEFVLKYIHGLKDLRGKENNAWTKETN